MPERDRDAHIEPSPHSTPQVDRYLERTEQRVDDAPGAGAPATKPQPLDPDGSAPGTGDGPDGPVPHRPR